MAKTKAHQRYRLKPTESHPKGQIVPGVTTIVGVLDKPALVPWANKMGLKGIDTRKYVDDKADIGTLAHAMIVNELTDKKTDTSDYSQQQIESAENACLSFYEWQKKHKLVITSAEIPLVSETYQFGGKYDILGIIDHKEELLDLKTGSGIWPESIYQMGGYLILLEEAGCIVDRVRILNIPRSEDEGFREEVLSGRVMSLAKEMFLHCLEIYKIQKDIKKLRKH
jgi:hypothetical protein